MPFSVGSGFSREGKRFLRGKGEYVGKRARMMQKSRERRRGTATRTCVGSRDMQGSLLHLEATFDRVSDYQTLEFGCWSWS